MGSKPLPRKVCTGPVSNKMDGPTVNLLFAVLPPCKGRSGREGDPRGARVRCRQGWALRRAPRRSSRPGSRPLETAGHGHSAPHRRLGPVEDHGVSRPFGGVLNGGERRTGLTAQPVRISPTMKGAAPRAAQLALARIAAINLTSSGSRPQDSLSVQGPARSLNAAAIGPAPGPSLPATTSWRPSSTGRRPQARCGPCPPRPQSAAASPPPQGRSGGNRD